MELGLSSTTAEIGQGSSNTQPVIVLRFEADSQEELSRIEQKIQSSLEEVLTSLFSK